MNENAPLPAAIESQLSELELRHKMHLRMLDWHHERKHIRRERHRSGFHKIKPTAQVLP